MTTLVLKPDSVDYDSSVREFTEILRAKPAWTGNIENQTGRVLIDFASTINVFAQQRILRALQEAFPETAVSDRAHYSHAAMQGVRLRRKSPAFTSVSLSSTSALSIPAYTQIVAGDSYLFNREDLFLYAGFAKTVTLYEGVIKEASVQGLGTDYQMFIPFESGFVVADSDVVVKVNGSRVPSTKVGVWDLKNSEGFEDRTLPDGRLCVVFGNGAYGTRPSSSSKVDISYVVTQGASTSNNQGISGSRVSCSDFPSLSGTVLTSLSGGIDELPAVQYKNLSSQTFGTFGSAVTPRQYQAVAREFPGIVDVIMFAQREIDPTDHRLMNTIKVVPLTTSGWKASDTTNFLKYLEESTMFSPVFYIENPEPFPKDVIVEVFCYNWADLTQVKTEVESAIRGLFSPRRGYINLDIHLTEIATAIKDSHPGVEYSTILKPTESLIISPSPVKNVSALPQASMGSLLAGVKNYAVGVTVSTFSGTGFVKPTSVATAVNQAANEAVLVTWEPSPNAVSYHVYGRTSSGMFLLATVPAGTTSYLDTGLPSSTTRMPTKSSLPVQYLTLNILSVKTSYSKRQRT